MNIRKRLFRKPFTTVLWLLVIILMTGFLTVGVTLKYSSDKLAEGLDKRNTAIAVRTDPSAAYEDGKLSVERRFTSADAEALEAMDAVKAVRNNCLSGAFCGKLEPITETNRYKSWESFGDIKPYYNTIAVGMVEDVSIRDERIMLTVWCYGMPELFYELSDLEKIVVNNYWLTVELFADDLKGVASGIEPNREYVFCGVMDPRRSTWGRYGSRYTLSLGFVSVEDGYILGRAPGFGMAEIPDGCKYEPYSFPAMEQMNLNPGETVEDSYLGPESDWDIEKFFEETPHEIWRDYRDAWEKQQHSLPVIGTDRLESMFIFVRGEAEIVDGRSFTQEEYDSGAHSLLVSEKLAQRCGLKVGDSLSISQFLCAGDPSIPTNPSAAAKIGGMLSDPEVDRLDINREYAPEEEFEIVGIYRLAADWSGGTYSVTPNTLFMPRSAQIEGAFGAIPDASLDPEDTCDVYGPYLTIELKNGSADEFRYELSRSPYAGQFYLFDQGFEAVQKNLNELSKTSNRLMWISAAGWLLLFVLFLLMYQGGQKRSVGIMRSLGRMPHQAAFYLAASGLIVVIMGVLLGTLIGRFVLDSVQTRIIDETIGSVDLESGEVYSMTEEDIKELVSESIPGAEMQVKLGAAQLAVMTTLISVQAVLIARREPRELMDP